MVCQLSFFVGLLSFATLIQDFYHFIIELLYHVLCWVAFEDPGNHSWFRMLQRDYLQRSCWWDLAYFKPALLVPSLFSHQTQVLVMTFKTVCKLSQHLGTIKRNISSNIPLGPQWSSCCHLLAVPLPKTEYLHWPESLLFLSSPAPTHGISSMRRWGFVVHKSSGGTTWPFYFQRLSHKVGWRNFVRWGSYNMLSFLDL